MITLWRLWRRIGGWRGILADALLVWNLVRDPRVPVWPKLIFPLVLAYIFSPLSLPFQWIPFLGQVDDIGVTLLALAAFLRLSPPDLVSEHAQRLTAELREGRRYGRLGKVARPSFERWIRRLK